MRSRGERIFWAALARKCVKDGHVTYTDQPCPPGSRELAVDGAVTSLPGR